ncbi:unnamed protein product [Rhodiola kirilowii]
MNKKQHEKHYPRLDVFTVVNAELRITQITPTCDYLQLIPPQPSKEICYGHPSASLITPHLQNLLQQTAVQQDFILNLMSCLEPPETLDGSQNGRLPPLPRGSESNGNAEVAASERERFLLSRISELQFKMLSLTDELNAERLKFMQLQQQLNSVPDGA